MNGLDCLLLVLTFRIQKLENYHAREMVSIGNIACESLKLFICLYLLFTHIPQEGQVKLTDLESVDVLERVVTVPLSST